MMNRYRESDNPIVPVKSSNKAVETVAEKMEERGLTEGNSREQNIYRTQGRASMQSELERVRQAAREDKDLKFTALLHHVYNINTLREAYYSIKRYVSTGTDGETWSEYGEKLEENIQELSKRLKRGAYRAKPVLRISIPKPDGGGERLIGILVLEDKLVQRAVVEVLNRIYEEDFQGFSYGFRPGRSPHNALDAVHTALYMKVSWVLDADIRRFFDDINHKWLVKFLEHRIADRRVIRLIKKWLKAGILEKGIMRVNKKGTQQGGSISPLLANIYLHYVFDLWVHQWRQRKSRGEVYVVRYCDDFILGFQYKSDAELFLKHLKLRLQKFCLELHPEKTRLIEFGRFAEGNRNNRGQGGRPETFKFLGFTHISGKDRKGKYKVIRQTISKRMRAKLKGIRIQLRRKLHEPIREVGKWLRRVVRGHMNYFSVPGNFEAISLFRYRIIRLWHRSLKRRSQKHRLNWEKMNKLIDRWLPKPRIIHPYPLERFARQHPR